MCGIVAKKTRISSDVEIRRMKNMIEPDKTGRFCRPSSRDQLLRAYNESQAFVLSGFKETSGVALIKEMSCDLPVIATKCGDPESIIPEFYLGELTEMDAESIFLAMKKVYLNGALYSTEEIRSFAVSRFSGEFTTRQLIDIYQQVT